MLFILFPRYLENMPIGNGTFKRTTKSTYTKALVAKLTMILYKTFLCSIRYCHIKLNAKIVAMHPMCSKARANNMNSITAWSGLTQLLRGHNGASSKLEEAEKSKTVLRHSKAIPSKNGKKPGPGALLAYKERTLREWKTITTDRAMKLQASTFILGSNPYLLHRDWL